MKETDRPLITKIISDTLVITTAQRRWHAIRRYRQGGHYDTA